MMKQFFQSTRTRIIAGALAVFAIGGIAGAVIFTAMPTFAASFNAPLAQTATPKHDLSAYCQTYLTSLEKSLNVTQAQLISANQTALKAALQQAVTDGKITQTQATQIENSIATALANNPNVCSNLNLLHMGHRGMGHGGFGGANIQQLMAARAAVLGAIANEFGITTTDLQTQLQNGAPILSIASSHNVTQSQLNATIVSSLKTQLDAAVKNNQITAAQETQFVTMVTTQLSNGNYGMLGLGRMPNFGNTPSSTPGANQ